MKKELSLKGTSVEAHPWKINRVARAVRKAMSGQGAMLAAAVPALLAISAGSASAQVAAPADASTSAPAAASADGTLKLDQVVVTATRRSSTLQEVPGTIQSISATTLTDLGVQAVSDLPALTPGLVTAKAATVVTFLRGVGINSSGFTTEAPVAIYLDGLYMPNPASGVFSFNNIERIEVLKGPQGTLYGRNSTAGLISVVTRDPEPQQRMDVSVGYESFNTTNLSFYGSTPLAQDLFLSVSAISSKQDKGWGRNTVTGDDVMKKDEQGAHVKLLWKAAPGTKVTLSGFYDHNDSDIGLVSPLYPGTVGIDGTHSLGNSYDLAARSDPRGVTQQSSVALKIEHDAGFANFLSLTGYQYAKSNQYTVPNGIPGNPVLGQSALQSTLWGNSKAISQEFQLSSKPSDSRFDWIVGAFYFHNDTMVGQDTWSTCLGAICALAPTPTRVLTYPTTRSSSVYADGTYKIAESTRLTLGVRYTDDTKGLTGVQMPLAGFPNSVAALPPTAVLHAGDPYPGNPTGIPTSISFPKTTFRGVLAQDLAKDVNAYLSFNRGFKSGEFNPGVFNNPPSRPETLDAIEIGLKSQLFDRRLRLNASIFNYNYDDMQLRSTAPPAPPGSFLQLNAANARVKGMDVDFTFRATSNLTLNGGFEILDARFKTFTGGTCFTQRTIAGPILGGVASAACNLSGYRMPNAPKFSSSLGFNYSVETSAGALMFAANDQYRSDYPFVADGSLQNKAYHLVNASATMTLPGDHFDIQLYARNLANKFYMTGATGGIVGNDVMYPGAPRTIGVTLGYHY